MAGRLLLEQVIDEAEGAPSSPVSISVNPE